MNAPQGSFIVYPCRRVEGALRVPGDKSISHRALLVGAVGEGPMEIAGLSPAADVAASRRAIESLGAHVHDTNPQLEGSQDSTGSRDLQILVEGGGWDGLESPRAPIDVANSGTTLRVLLGILAGSSVDAVLTGDDSIRARPMGRVVRPLRDMGAEVTGSDDDEHAPLRVRGRQLHGVDHDLPVASAQVKTALLLAGLRASGETSVREPVPTRDHTERLLRYLGIQIEESLERLIVKSTKIFNAMVSVPGDLSSAAFLLVAGAIRPGSHVVVRDVGINPTRVGILDLLRAYGADVTVDDVRESCGEPVGTVSLRAADRRPLGVSGELTVRALDELPLVAVLGAAADGVTEVRDAAELRVKEADRIAAVVDGLRRMGAGIEPRPDGFAVRGPVRLQGTTVEAYGDHRIAMAMAVAGLAAEGPTRIEGWDCVGVSYPEFERDLESIVVP